MRALWAAWPLAFLLALGAAPGARPAAKRQRPGAPRAGGPSKAPPAAPAVDAGVTPVAAPTSVPGADSPDAGAVAPGPRSDADVGYGAPSQRVAPGRVVVPPRAAGALPGTSPAPTAPVAATLTPAAHAGAGTRCGACHAPSSWAEVKFNHDPTGFPLRGRHAHTVCRECHAQGFKVPLARTCSGCHVDPHAGDVGARCDGCHEETGWRTSFGIEAHRRSGFPLLGSHAAVPCFECHLDAREKRFARPAVQCAACHEADRARTLGTAMDHQRLALVGPCGDCHGAVRFSPARYPAHDLCFPLSGGAHSAFECTQCHTSMPAAVTPGSCNTRTAACTACHEHRCAGPGSTLETDRRHAGVDGYQCRDSKCAGCHQGGGAP